MSAAADKSCRLCGLPAGGSDQVFCCLGCKNVYAILEESGVIAQGGDFRESEVYRQSLKLGLISNAASRKAEIPRDAERREALYHVSGMWCGSCGWLIEHALGAEPGVVSAEVMFAADLLRVTYCPQFVPPGRIPERVALLGYQASEYSAQTERDRSDRRDLLLRIGVAAFLWMNVMMISLVIYASYWEAISDTARRVVPAVLMALTAPAVFYSAWPILRVAFLGLRAATLRMEALLALGILAAYGYSSAQVFLGGRHYYFDTACAIVTLVLLGKLLERGAKERTTQAISLLYRMMPRKARLLHGGSETFVAVEALEPGAVFVVKAGERVPADGVVVSGSSHLDESVLTGESAPRRKSPGDQVIGGSVNTGTALEIRATRVGAGSTLAQILRSVESAMANRAPIERVVDRVSRVFVPVVVAVAVVILVGGLAAGLAAPDALMRAIAVLVIACPCALGIATPLAITSAVGSASRRGILIRDSRVLEEIGKVDVVILDKTGTVTEGNFSVVESAPSDGGWFAAAAALEAWSEHPLGRAVVRRAQESGLAIPAAVGVEVRKGLGLTGVVDGRRWAVGNRRLITESGVVIQPEIEDLASAWEARGCTVAFAAREGVCAGAMAFGDRVRDGASALVSALRARGVRTVLLSGDGRAATGRVAAAIGAGDYRAEVLPDGKREFVERCRAEGSVVAMVGDGVNDAPALAAANLGIALGSGADLAMQAAPVVLMSVDLDRVMQVFDLSRRTLRVVRQNLFWAFAYNVAGISLAAAGVLTPILAAGAMVLSNLSVIANSARLR